MMRPNAKKRFAKPTKDEIARARAYIKSMDWKFAKSMPQWPHWWVLREDGSAREFDFVDRLIKEFGYADNWGTRTGYYLVIGKIQILGDRGLSESSGAALK